MTKFLALCTTLIAFLVGAVAAIPQEHLAPAAHAKDAPKSFAKRDDIISTTINYDASETANPVLRVHEDRQVHNADYGSDNGPSGNPQTGQQGTQEGSSPAPTAGSDSDSGAADYESKRRNVSDAISDAFSG